VWEEGERKWKKKRIAKRTTIERKSGVVQKSVGMKMKWMKWGGVKWAKERKTNQERMKRNSTVTRALGMVKWMSGRMHRG
jgi:hypothetical protein